MADAEKDQPKYQLDLPQEFFDKGYALMGEFGEALKELRKFLKTGRRGVWAGMFNWIIGLTISGLMLLFYFSIFRGNASQSPYSNYAMAPVQLHAVSVPGDSLGAAGLLPSPTTDTEKTGTFLFIDLHGVISDEPQQNGLFSQPGLSFLDNVLGQLGAASRLPDIRAVILLINSPGGTVSGSEKLRNEILRLKKAGITVIAAYEDLAASGAIYASVGADYIIASRSSLVGSIGVIFSYFNISGFMGRHGLKLEVFKSGSMKDMGSFARDPTQEERARLEQIIKEDFDRFVSIVMEGRNLARSKVLAFADGSIFSPAQAVNFNLIDQVSDDPRYDAALKAMELTGVKYPSLVKPLRKLPGVIGAFASIMRPPRQKTVQEEIGDMIATVPTLRYEWKPFGSFVVSQ